MHVKHIYLDKKKVGVVGGGAFSFWVSQIERKSIAKYSIFFFFMKYAET